MIRRPPRSTRTDTLFPYTTLFRSLAALGLAAFTVIATLIGHPFWTFEGADFQRQLTTALEHLAVVGGFLALTARSEEHTSELQSLMRISYAVFCLKKKIQAAYFQLLAQRHHTH